MDRIICYLGHINLGASLHWRKGMTVTPVRRGFCARRTHAADLFLVVILARAGLVRPFVAATVIPSAMQKLNVDNLPILLVCITGSWEHIMDQKAFQLIRVYRERMSIECLL